LTSAGLLGFSFVTGWTTSIMAVALFTLGEILIFPSNSLLIDQLAVEHLRGTYFGAAQFRKLGSFAGPILGGFLLSQAGGQVMLWMMSLITLGGILFFRLGNRAHRSVPVAVKKAGI
jgi:predicted MFS family arabinose efflux permease